MSTPNSARQRLLLFAVHYVAALLLLAPGYIRPDSVGIYAYLRSLVIDRDLLFFDEWFGFGLVRNGVTLYKEVTTIGTLANHWSVGTSLFAAPAYLVAHLFTLARGATADGFSGPYGMTLAFVNVTFGALAALVALRAIRQFTSASNAMMWIALACTIAGTPLLFYIYRQPLGSHVPSTLAVGALLYLLATDERDDRAAFLAGLTLGLAVTIRLQHVVLIPAVGYYLLRTRRPLRYDAFFSAGAVLGFVPQAVAWTVIYGHPLGPMVKGVGTWTPFQQIGLLETLFSSWHGLLPWSPVIALSIIGWLMELRGPRRYIAELCLVAFVAQWMANGLLDCCFWGGMSFGSRRMSDLFVAYAIGVAWTLLRFGRWAIAAASIATAWSMALLCAAAAGTLNLNRDVGPSDLVAAMTSTPWLSIAQTLAKQSPLARAPGLTIAALAVSAAFAVACILIAATRRRSTYVLTAYIVVASVVIGLSYRATRTRVTEEARRFHIDVPLSREAGPLVDVLVLKQHALQHYERRGKERRAAELRRDIEELQRRPAVIRAMQSSPQ